MRRRTTVARLLAFAFATAVLLAILGRAATLLQSLYFPAAVAVGLCLFWLRPTLYVGFTWWLWFLSPLVRRLVDFELGFNETNPVLLAPTVVTGLAAIDLVRYAPQLLRRFVSPFVVILAALGYGYVVGITAVGLLPASYSFVSWGAPVCFGCYLALHWKRYPAYREVMQRTFLWGMLLIGLYGVLQFLNPLPWDRYWLIQSGMTSSSGNPVPLEIRVFGTLNSPGPYAAVLTVGLLFAVTHHYRWRGLAITAGALAFLLSLVRAGWGGWALGSFLQWTYARRRARWHLAVGTLVMLLVLVPLLTFGPFAETISSRVETLSALERDNSFVARQEFYRVFAALVASNPVGFGLGTTGMATVLREGDGVNAFESGWLDILFSLGWPGGLLFLTGCLWLVRQALPWNRKIQDPFAGGCRAATLAFAWMAFFGNVFTGVAGALLWSSVALSIAATLSEKSARLMRPVDQAVG